MYVLLWHVMYIQMYVKKIICLVYLYNIYFLIKKENETDCYSDKNCDAFSLALGKINNLGN